MVSKEKLEELKKACDQRDQAILAIQKELEKIGLPKKMIASFKGANFAYVEGFFEGRKDLTYSFDKLEKVYTARDKALNKIAKLMKELGYSDSYLPEYLSFTTLKRALKK